MKNTELETKVKQAFSHATPDVLDSVLRHCENQKGNVIVMKEAKKKSKRWVKQMIGIAAVVAILIAGTVSAGVYRTNYAVASTVSLDVNPSIEITANEKERVLSVKALNEDGQIVIGDMDFKGSDLEVAVNALIGSMLRNGYLSELSNSVLISVDNDNPEKSAALKEKLMEEVRIILQTDTFDGAVLSQTIVPDAELQTLAESYGITTGKAQLIQQIVEKNPLYTFQELVPLSINELNLLCESAQTELDHVASVGTASDKNYIGAEKAKEAALSHAVLQESAVTEMKIKLDYEDGIMIYEVEFKADGYEYEYEINAKTGTVVKFEKESDDGHNSQKPGQNNSTVSADSFIGEEKAREAALSHAGVQAEDVREYKADLDEDDGSYVYEIEFKAGNYEYEYEIDAMTGAVVKYDEEMDNHNNWNPTQNPEQNNSSQSPSQNNSPDSTDAFIGEEKAREIAFTHAGVQAGEVGKCKTELDRDDGRYIYEVEFEAGKYEYEYEIDALTGAVLKSEKDD